MTQTVWRLDGSGWRVVGKAPLGMPVDHLMTGLGAGTVFSISVGGLVIFRGRLG